MENLLTGIRIGLLTTSASRLGGGVFEAVALHAAMISRLGGKAHVIALKDSFSEQDAGRFAQGSVTHCETVGPRQIAYSPSLLKQLTEAELDCLHLHGIWQYPSRAAYSWARKTGRPYVISPHGMLDRWITPRGKFKKALARFGYEHASWQQAACLHALTGNEAKDIARETGRDDPIVIPNFSPPISQTAVGDRGNSLLYLGRIHPKKNISALVEAWRAIGPEVEKANATLTIAGWGDEADVATLKDTLADAPPSVRFIGPAYGEMKEALLSNARFFILPSFSEGLPMAVLEAWAHGTPSMISQECNLPEGFDAGCAKDCGMSAKDIAGTIIEALDMSEDNWQIMSRAALALAGSKFSADTVALQWAECYRGLVNKKIDL